MWSLLKIAEAETPLKFPIHSLRRCITNCDLTPVLSIWRRKYCHLDIPFISYIGLSLHIFQSGVRSWPISVSQCKIKVFNPQAWDSRLRHERWQMMGGVFYDNPKQWLQRRLLKFVTFVLFFLQKTPGPGTYCKTYQTPMPDTIKKMARNYGLFFTSGTYGEYYW